MASRSVVAWIEMIGATLIAATLLAIDFIRQQPFSGLADAVFSLSLTAILATLLLLAAGIRLRRSLAGLADPRPAPPTAWSMIGIFVVVLAVLLAMTPALIQL